VLKQTLQRTGYRTVRTFGYRGRGEKKGGLGYPLLPTRGKKTKKNRPSRHASWWPVLVGKEKVGTSLLQRRATTDLSKNQKTKKKGGRMGGKKERDSKAPVKRIVHNAGKNNRKNESGGTGKKKGIAGSIKSCPNAIDPTGKTGAPQGGGGGKAAKGSDSITNRKEGREKGRMGGANRARREERRDKMKKVWCKKKKSREGKKGKSCRENVLKNEERGGDTTPQSHVGEDKSFLFAGDQMLKRGQKEKRARGASYGRGQEKKGEPKIDENHGWKRKKLQGGGGGGTIYQPIKKVSTSWKRAKIPSPRNRPSENIHRLTTGHFDRSTAWEGKKTPAAGRGKKGGGRKNADRGPRNQRTSQI